MCSRSFFLALILNLTLPLTQNVYTRQLAPRNPPTAVQACSKTCISDSWLQRVPRSLNSCLQNVARGPNTFSRQLASRCPPKSAQTCSKTFIPTAGFKVSPEARSGTPARYGKIHMSDTWLQGAVRGCLQDVLPGLPCKGWWLALKKKI